MITQMGAESVVLSAYTKYDVWEGGEGGEGGEI